MPEFVARLISTNEFAGRKYDPVIFLVYLHIPVAFVGPVKGVNGDDKTN